MADNPLLILLTLGAAGYVFKLWLDDYSQARRGSPHPRALPGATPAGGKAVLVAVGGALVLLGLETGGEYAMGIVDEQSEITVLFGCLMLAAAFFEELIFRGFLVVRNRGRLLLIASIVFFSLVFTLAHPFLWDYTPGESAWRFWEGTLTVDLSGKAWFSSTLVFANSLWFYTVRFYALNPNRSLIPCFAAHFAGNLGVFAIKAAQGFVSGWW